MFGKVYSFIRLIIDDILLLVGVFFITYGVFAIYVPAGYIALGLSIIGIAYILAKRKEIQ